MTTSFNFQYWAFYVCCLCLCVGETFGRRDKKKADEVRSARQRAAVATAEYADDPIFSVHGAVRAMLPHCTWHSCFDISRCPDPSLQHSIFVYGGSRSLPAMPLKYITEDPLRACLFLARLTLPFHPSELASSLQHWGRDGSNHLLWHGSGFGDKSFYEFSISDDNATISTAYLGKAMLFSCNFLVSEFRPDFDVAKPLAHSHTEKWALQTGLKKSSAAARKFFIGFKGSIYFTRELARSKLVAMHDPADAVAVVGKCKFPNDARSHQVLCSRLNKTYDLLSFDQVANSTLWLVPQGYHPASYRLAEASCRRQRTVCQRRYHFDTEQRSDDAPHRKRSR